MDLRYYNGETKNPFLKKDSEPINFLSFDLMLLNPRAHWWEFETLYGYDFPTVLEAVTCYARKHCEYAPISSDDIIKSYLDNAVNTISTS